MKELEYIIVSTINFEESRGKALFNILEQGLRTKISTQYVPDANIFNNVVKNDKIYIIDGSLNKEDLAIQNLPDSASIYFFEFEGGQAVSNRYFGLPLIYWKKNFQKIYFWKYDKLGKHKCEFKTIITVGRSVKRHKQQALEVIYAIILKKINGSINDDIAFESIDEEPSDNRVNFFWKMDSFLFTVNIFCEFLRTFTRIGQSLWKKINAQQKVCWQLGFGTAPISEFDINHIYAVSAEQGGGLADPFAFEYENEKFVFYERIPPNSKKGVISVGKWNGGSFEHLGDAIKTDYHLSYPNIISYEGNIYMFPETSAKLRLERWKCIDFPLIWELDATYFNNQMLADSTVFQTDDQKWWMATSKKFSRDSGFDHLLYLYMLDSPLMGVVSPHPQNPIVVDPSIARNAGGFFKDVNGVLYRASQYNDSRGYGAGLNIQKIININEKSYEERTSVRILASDIPEIGALHHISFFNDGTWVMDFEARRVNRYINQRLEI